MSREKRLTKQEYDEELAIRRQAALSALPEIAALMYAKAEMDCREALYLLGQANAEVERLKAALRWYVENDDTNEGGKWEEYNANSLEGKRRAMKLLGMEVES